MHIISMRDSDNLKTFNSSLTPSVIYMCKNTDCYGIWQLSCPFLMFVHLCLPWTWNWNQGGLQQHLTVLCTAKPHWAATKNTPDNCLDLHLVCNCVFMSVTNTVKLHHVSSNCWFPDMVLQFSVLSSHLITEPEPHGLRDRNRQCSYGHTSMKQCWADKIHQQSSWAGVKRVVSQLYST